MPSTISAGTTAGSAIAIAGDTSGALELRTNGTTTAVTIDTAQNTTFAKPINIGGATLGAGNATTFKNRIINGAMVIDQRNAGASVTPASGAYTLDRWVYNASQASKFTVQQSSTSPVGFVNSVILTVASAVSVGASDAFTFSQIIEGYNVADLNWGGANAKTVTLSFWVRSSLTGQNSFSFTNSGARSYVGTYTISAANTWEYKTITVTGDTSGTWNTTNGTGLYVRFNLGGGTNTSTTAGSWVAGNYTAATGDISVVGTNGATFYITGVQLEVGSTATSFDYRPYGTELALCQRYYEQSNGSEACFQPTLQATNRYFTIRFLVQKRASPTMSATFTQGGSGSATISLYTGASNAGLANGTQADVSSWTASAEL